jgi:hypothetical protein
LRRMGKSHCHGADSNGNISSSMVQDVSGGTKPMGLIVACQLVVQFVIIGSSFFFWGDRDVRMGKGGGVSVFAPSGD